jgi:hypothetical protein
MPPEEYVKAFDKALSDLEDRVQRRDLLNAEIAGLRETVRVLSNRVALAPDRQQRLAQLLAMIDYATPNLTDSIRGLMTQIYPTYLTAIEVRNTLEERGFNFEDFSNSLSACHAALKRMLADKEVETGPEANGKPTYKRKLPRIPSPSESGYYIGELIHRYHEQKGGPLAMLTGNTSDMSGLIPDVPNPFGKNLAEMMQKPSENPQEKQRIIPRRRGIGSRMGLDRKKEGNE